MKSKKKKRPRNLVSKLVFQELVEFAGRQTPATVVNVHFMGFRIYQKMFINPEWMGAKEMRTNF